ncbi:MAG TPA: diguanylate cyclase [Rhodanobacteraceae bacterium]
MRKSLAGILLWCVSGVALAATVLSPLQMRSLSSSDPHALVAKVRAALDAGSYAHDPAGERDALWWMGHAAVSVSDEAAITEAVARLKSLGSVENDSLAESYAGFLTADRRVMQGDSSGVGDALQAAALQLDSPDPARRALAKFQLCDAYSMASQYQHSQPLCQEAEDAFAALHDDWDQAQAENDEGNNAYGMGHYAAARQFYLDAQALYRKLGDRSQMLMVGDNLAQVYLKQGKPNQAIALSRASLADERAAGRESDALNSQYDIARALEATGKRAQAMDMLASTIDEARKAGLQAQLPDLLQEQSSMAARNGDFKLALDAEREAYALSRKYWASSLDSQQSELGARYAAREKELRIRELERNNQVKNLKLKAAESGAERNALQMRRQRSMIFAALVAAFGLLVGLVSLLLLLRSQRRHARELRRQALEDPLTGVENRRGFFKRAGELLARRDAHHPSLHALLLFDFDFFKRINDRYGHPFGDVVLNVSLQRLREVVGTRGQLARLGGEEFVVLCPGLGGTAALQLADDMLAAMASLAFPNAPEGFEVSISIGLALFDGTRCHDVGSWLRAADEAVYAAKARGRDQVVVAQAVEGLLLHASVDAEPAA